MAVVFQKYSLQIQIEICSLVQNASNHHFVVPHSVQLHNVLAAVLLNIYQKTISLARTPQLNNWINHLSWVSSES